MKPDKDIQEIVRNLTKSIIIKIAPEEIDMFDEISESYFENKTFFSGNKRTAGDKPVGFGIDGILQLMTPEAIGVVTTVLGFIATKLWGASQDVLMDKYKEKLKLLFTKNKDKAGKNKPEPIQISKELLKEIHAKTFDLALKANINEEKAKNMADEMIAQLVLQ